SVSSHLVEYFFFSSRRRHTSFSRDWSSDVCSSDLNFLFDGTIAENIAFSRPGASRDEVLAAGAVAHCDEFVSRMPDGYDTVVGRSEERRVGKETRAA